MNLHHKISFEDVICTQLQQVGWLYSSGDANHYDRPRALFPADVAEWVKTSQPAAWASLTKSHGAAAEAALLGRVQP